MPQQLQLFSETLSSQEDATDLLPTDLLLNETRLLFRHQGSNAELIERVLTAIKAIQSLREKSDVGESTAPIGR
ncbi:MAG: hypothetical protein KME15_25965 [Drouetiella hepatica Uher 2000/2452]|jgi:hypothetical protein|uniref:Uncharacterized protein n=1 Tax=Drouetiella hepatica Uher 2000/2452 TaxID=904376 RepID=A0A951QHY2_9CYAN|nr:hypothetical protein [Drouetiella hepatica Uher 2000/2452]